MRKTTLFSVGNLLIAGGILLSMGACGRAEARGAKVGNAAPAWSLPDTNGKTHKLADFKGKYVVLEWLNHGCPFVKKHYNTGNMQKLQRELTGKGVVWLSVVSSAPGKQGHYKPAKANRLTKSKKAAPTAVLLDPAGKTGRAYGARTTPHMYVISPAGRLIYNGAIDDNSSYFKSKADVMKAKNYVRLALNEAMSGKPVSVKYTRPYGCSVKY